MNKIQGTIKRPRVSIFRSNRFISAQFVDDENGKTLFSGTTKKTKDSKKPVEKALALGQELALQAKAKKIDAIVFDRHDKKYHGQVSALAEGLRQGGLKF